VHRDATTLPQIPNIDFPGLLASAELLARDEEPRP